MYSIHATPAEVITSHLPPNPCTVESLSSCICAIKRLPATYTEHQQNAIDSFLLPTLQSAHVALTCNPLRRITLIKQTKATFCALFEGGSFTISRNRDGSEFAQIGDIELLKVPTSYEVPLAWIFPQYTLPLVGVDSMGSSFFVPPTARLSHCTLDRTLTSEQICDIAKQALRMLADFHQNSLEHNMITTHAFALIEDRLVITNFMEAAITQEADKGQRDLLDLALTLLYLLVGIVPTTIEPPADPVREAKKTFKAHINDIDLNKPVEELAATILKRSAGERLNAQQMLSIFYEYFTPIPIESEQEILAKITRYFGMAPEDTCCSLTQEGIRSILRAITPELPQLMTMPSVAMAIDAFLFPTLRSAEKSFDSFPNHQAVTISKKTLDLFKQIVISEGNAWKLYSLNKTAKGNALCKYKVGEERVASKENIERYHDNFCYQEIERDALWALASKYVIPFYGVISRPEIIDIALLELADTDLFSYQRSLTKEMLLCVVTDLLKGVAYLHERGVVHGDIKPGNILVLKEGRCVFADFETAHSFDATQSIIWCTECFAPPEVLYAYRKNPKRPVYEQYGGATDIWSLGALLVSLLTRGKEMLFSEEIAKQYVCESTAIITDEEVSGQIASVFARHAATLLEIDPDGIVQNMARKMLVVDKESRPTAATLVSELRGCKTIK